MADDKLRGLERRAVEEDTPEAKQRVLVERCRTGQCCAHSNPTLHYIELEHPYTAAADTLITFREGSLIPIGQLAGVLYVAAPAVFRIVARYAHDRVGFGVAYRELRQQFEGVLADMQRGGLIAEYHVICDATTNPFEIVEQKRIGIQVMAQEVPVEYKVAGFVLGYKPGEGGARGQLEIEYIS